jgi:hypothetical protein
MYLAVFHGREVEVADNLRHYVGHLKETNVLAQARTRTASKLIEAIISKAIAFEGLPW